MTNCIRCNDKGYNTVYIGSGGYTDFGPRKYIELEPLGIKKIPCKYCNPQPFIEIPKQKKKRRKQKKKRRKLQQFQVTTKNLRRDSPITVHIPKKIWNKRYEYVIANRPDDLSVCYDVDESGACQMISTAHLSSLMQWWDENNEKEEIDLSD